MPEIQFNIPLPVVAIVTFIIGGIYKIWKLRGVVQAINRNQAETINKSYKNVFLNDSRDYLPSYMPLDPEHEMEDLSKNIIVRLYSGKNAILIYSRLLDCIEAHRSMLHHFRIDESLYKSEHCNNNYYQNVLLYFFLIDLLIKSKKERDELFSKFKVNDQFLYDNHDGYFKAYTTISYQNNQT